MRRAVIGMTLALAAVACSGPHSPLDVGIRAIDTNVLIGPARPTAAAVPPPSTSPGPVGFPGFVQPPTVFPPPKPTPPPLCPAADPLSSVAHEATTSATAPPVAATYRFLNKGFDSVGLVKTQVSDVATRTVSNITTSATGGNDFTYDLIFPQGAGVKTTTTYHVYPSQSSPADTTTPGIYIDKVVTEVPGSDPMSFAPAPPLLLMQFPAAIGLTWDSRGVDPLSRTVEQFTGTIVGTRVIDACGTRLSAWRVDITKGQIRAGLDSYTFEGSIYVAPQYGGLSIRDEIDRKGTVHKDVTDPGTPVELYLDARIMSEPRFPR